jgi:hypothetical protein
VNYMIKASPNGSRSRLFSYLDNHRVSPAISALRIAAMLALLLATPVFASTITVSTTGDSGAGTLRAALASANNGDTINFTNLTLPATITLTSDELKIFHNVTITGPGASMLTISGGGNLRVFDNQGATVSISGLTIANGKAFSSTTTNGAGQGGGIITFGSLTLTNVTLTNNSAAEGGAINNGLGSLTITNCTISNNAATAGTIAAGGGGIWNFGTAIISGSTISGNTAAGATTGNSNLSGTGGGILNEAAGAAAGNLTITNSTISGNIANGKNGGEGGGIINFPSSTLTITNSTISGNMANGISPGQSGGLENEGTATINGSTFSANVATNAAGGIFNNSGALTMTNSTVTGNTAGNNGGGIMNSGTAMSLSFVTISGNSANTDGFGFGGGDQIANFAAGATVKASLLANGTSTGNCKLSTAITSGGFNLSDDSSCNSSFHQASDINNQSVSLGTLGDNGGPTFTIALVSGPAIDAIPTASCTDVTGTAVATDQRGITRPQGSACDIGAFELVPTLQSQTITFNPLTNQVFGTGPITVSATSSSSLTVSFNSQTTPVCTSTGTNGATITLIMAGQCTIQAMQAGNSSFSPATPVNQSFQVTKAGQTISFAPLPNVPLSAGSITVSATATSGGSVTFNSLTSGTCSASGSTVTLTAGGTCTIQAVQTGTTNFTAAPSVNQSFLVTTVPQLVVTKSMSRNGTISVVVTITNNGSADANNVQLTIAKIASTATTTSLPATVGTATIAALGGSAQITVSFPGTAGASGAPSTLTLGGTYTGGSFSSTARVTLP